MLAKPNRKSEKIIILDAVLDSFEWMRWPQVTAWWLGRGGRRNWPPLVAQYGERVKPVTLEVRDEAAAKV